MTRRRWPLYVAVAGAVVAILLLVPLGRAFAANPCIVECQPPDCPPRTSCIKPDM